MENENFAIIRPEGTTTAYCSLKADNDRDRVTLYNATATPAERIKDHINEQIQVAHIYVEPVTLVDEQTGEATDAPRTVLITPEGVGYVAVSRGVFNAVRRIISIFGEPSTWDAPRTVRVKQISRGTNNILTLELV